MLWTYLVLMCKSNTVFTPAFFYDALFSPESSIIFCFSYRKGTNCYHCLEVKCIWCQEVILHAHEKHLAWLSCQESLCQNHVGEHSFVPLLILTVIGYAHTLNVCLNFAPKESEKWL